MNRTDRMYAIVEALRVAGSRGRTCAVLSERFEVSTRTIKRDIAALVEAGVPIVSFDGRGGGYSLMKNATLPPLAFSDAEATAIAIALRVEPDMPFAPDGESAMSKLIGAMTPAQRTMMERLAARIWMRLPSERRSPHANAIEEALRMGVIVSIDYDTAGRGQVETRLIEPMALVRTHNHWHVLAWCQSRKAGRMFRMDRISRAHATNQPVVPRDLQAVFGDPPPDALPIGAQHGM